MKKLLFLLLGGVLFAQRSEAQDPNFSQFFTSPLTLNPALTGKFDGVVRIAGNYRNQWPTINNAFKTATVSADMGILHGIIPETDQFGVGLLLFTDQAAAGALTNNYAALSVAYHKSLDEDGLHQLGAGFQGTYSSKRLDISKLTFADQLSPFGFTLPTNEPLSGSKHNLSYFDLNAGIFYNGSTNGYNNFYLGASMYHLTQPKETFDDNSNFLMSSRVTLQAGGKIPINGYDYIHLAANHSMQAKATNTTIGGAFAKNVNLQEEDPTIFYAGAWYRFGDAIIPYIGLEFGEWRLGASYDVNVSSLKTASNMRGGIELSLIYTRKYVDPNFKKLNCPKF